MTLPSPFAAAADRSSSSSPSSSLAIPKPRPAKVLIHAARTRGSATRLINHIQVLVYQNPPAVAVLEETADRLRNQPPSHRPEGHKVSQDEDARDAAHRLIDFINIYTQKRPVLIQAIDNVTREILAEEGRQRVAAQMATFGADDVATMVAIAEQLTKNRASTTGKD